MSIEINKLTELLTPAVEATGFELLGCEFDPQGRSSVLRLYIDSPEGVTVDDCGLVSTQVSAVLDVEDPIPGMYNLEVSSPGIDRPLFKLSHFEQAVGQKIKLRFISETGKKQRWSGELLAVEAGNLTLQLSEEIRREIAFDRVIKARIIPEF